MGDPRTPPAVPPTQDIPALVLPTWLLEVLRPAPVLRELAGEVAGTFAPWTLGGLPPDPNRPMTDLFNIKRPADAPLQVKVPPELNQQFVTLWSQHAIQGHNERGGTLALNKSTHAIELVNTATSDIGEHFNTDLNVGDGHEMVGIFHTHFAHDPALPKDASNPNRWSNAAPSGADISWALEKKIDISIVQGVTKNYMLVRTAETPSNWSPLETQRLREQYKQDLEAGMRSRNVIRDTEGVTGHLAQDLAAKYHLAYYEGKDGVFTRVVPPP